MKKILIIFFFFTLIILNFNQLSAQNKWILDTELSEIKFELPVLLSNNVKGHFSLFEGYVVVDKKNKKNNRAIFSVQINSIELNYAKYKEILLSNIFFDEVHFPTSIIDTKKFAVPKNFNNMEIEAELQIKNIIQVVPLKIKIIQLSNDLVQVKANTKFSRNSYGLGKDSWSSTLILRDKVHLKVNLFLNRE